MLIGIPIFAVCVAFPLLGMIYYYNRTVTLEEKLAWQKHIGDLSCNECEYKKAFGRD